MSAAKCAAGSCQQAIFRDGFCIDHFRTQKPGASPSRLVAAQDEKLSDKDRNTFKSLTRKVYVDQAKWYLNGFWREEGEQQAEEVWTIVHKFTALDPKKAAGNELDPVLSSHYLQGINKVMTALELKEALRRIDVDANGLMALLEYLLFKYNRSVLKCLNNPQGGSEEDKRKLDEAAARCEQLQKALDDLQVQLTNQKRAERDAKVAENNAHAAEAEARSAEAKVKVAEGEARAADADLKRQQDELAGKIKGLEGKIANPSTGAVAKGQAVQELAGLKGADPLPLRKAKITQEAAVRRVEAERKNAEQRRKQSEQDREAAIAARKAAEAQTVRVEAAVADTERKCREANDILEELKKHEGVPHGAIWWMQRQITEAKKYMPRSKQ